MADIVTIDVKGLSELGEILKQAGEKLTKRARNHSLDAAGRWMEAAVAQRAPVFHGEMKAKVTRKRVQDTELIGVRYEHIVAKSSRFPRKTRGTAPTTEDPGVYSIWVEQGRERQAAHPFMRPAMEAEWENAVEAFKADLATEVEKLGE